MEYTSDITNARGPPFTLVSNTINWKIILSYYVTGIPIDLVRALATFFFLWLTAEPLLQKLDRIKTKYALAE